MSDSADDATQPLRSTKKTPKSGFALFRVKSAPRSMDVKIGIGQKRKGKRRILRDVFAILLRQRGTYRNDMECSPGEDGSNFHADN